jgi:DNA mismatch endonuclease (patch repair protein)
MRALPRANTRPELALRSALHRLGLRFRVEQQLLAGSRRRADIVFRRSRVVCFVHGCFWHGCSTHMKWPARNSLFWREKIKRNRLKDEDTLARLSKEGWRVVVCWEHDDAKVVAQRIALLVRGQTRH